MEAEVMDHIRWEVELMELLSREPQAQDLHRKLEIKLRKKQKPEADAAEGDIAGEKQEGEGEAEIETKRRWYGALYEVDCVKVKDLLMEDGELIHEGWKPDLHASARHAVMGKIALHEAARRGDVQLVRDILERSMKMSRERPVFFLNMRQSDYMS
ncbi:unnamed protein product [Calypogeia fissa]